MPWSGVEPERVAPLPPQDSVSTNSTTRANLFFKRIYIIDILISKSMKNIQEFFDPGARQVAIRDFF